MVICLGYWSLRKQRYWQTIEHCSRCFEKNSYLNNLEQANRSSASPGYWSSTVPNIGRVWLAKKRSWMPFTSAQCRKAPTTWIKTCDKRSLTRLVVCEREESVENIVKHILRKEVKTRLIKLSLTSFPFYTFVYTRWLKNVSFLKTLFLEL